MRDDSERDRNYGDREPDNHRNVPPPNHMVNAPYDNGMWQRPMPGLGLVFGGYYYAPNNVAFPMSQNEYAPRPPYYDNMPKPPMSNQGADLYMPEFSIWNHEMMPWQAQQRYAQEQTIKIPTRTNDQQFFEECFSPRRGRRNSIDSSHSADSLENRRVQLDDDEDDPKAILRLANLQQLRPGPQPDRFQEFVSRPKPLSHSDMRQPISHPQGQPPMDNQIFLPSQPQNLFPPNNNVNNQNNIRPVARGRPRSRGNTRPLPIIIEPELINNKMPEMFEARSYENPIQYTPTNVTQQFYRQEQQQLPTELAPRPIVNLDSKKNEKEVFEEARCNCRKSKCLKLYCECFAAQRICNGSCSCLDCYNKDEYGELRGYFLQDTLEKNPNAFKSKFKKLDVEKLTLHTRGCNCRKTGCLKRYCECFSADTKCTNLCKCTECCNFCEESTKLELHEHHEKVLRKRKRKTKTFVQNLLDKLKMVKTTSNGDSLALLPQQTQDQQNPESQG